MEPRMERLRRRTTLPLAAVASVGRTPRTGESVSVNAKRVPYFKPGKEMRERLNLQEAAYGDL